MTYEYKSHIYLAETALNVKDLASQTAFYQQVIGLEILSQTETESILGLGGKVLVQLIQAQESGEVREHYGLYHLAILLPAVQTMVTVKLFTWKIWREMALNSIEISQFPHGIFEKMDALSE